MTNLFAQISKLKYFKPFLKVSYLIFIFLQLANLFLNIIIPIISLLSYSKNLIDDLSLYLVYEFGYLTLFFFPYLISSHFIKTIFTKEKYDIIIFAFGISFYLLLMSGPVGFLVTKHFLPQYLIYIYIFLFVVFYFYYFIYSILDFRRYLKLSKVNNVTL